MKSLIDRSRNPYRGLCQLCEQYEFPAVVIVRLEEWEELTDYIHPARMYYDELDGWWFLISERTRCYPQPRKKRNVSPFRLDLTGEEIRVEPFP